MIHRNLAGRLQAALADSPVVFLQGARQTGKSTLALWLARTKLPFRYLTLDDATALAAARADPEAFVSGLHAPTVIDEAQRAPDLGLAIKAAVDRERRPGRFLLTGSAGVLFLPKLAGALAGRMEILTLWPFSQGELERRQEGFIDAVFKPRLPAMNRSEQSLPALINRILRGGYPEMARRRSQARRRAWFGSYFTTILEREVRDLANIEGLTEMPRLLALLAARVGSLVNHAEVSRSLSLPQTTLKRYFALLEGAFMVHLLPSWSANLGKRLVKSPKLYLIDTGLLCSVLGLERKRLMSDPALVGRTLENFVVLELKKQSTWSKVQPGLFHFRLESGLEVDVVLEGPGGGLVGLEVKASASIKPDDFRGLKGLAELTGERFRRGVVLYCGEEPVAFARNLVALPIGALWET